MMDTDDLNFVKTYGIILLIGNPLAGVITMSGQRDVNLAFDVRKMVADALQGWEDVTDRVEREEMSKTTIKVKDLDDKDIRIPSVFYHTRQAPEFTLESCIHSEEIWFTADPNDKFSKIIRNRKDNKGPAKTFKFDLQNPSCPLEIHKIRIGFVSNYLGPETVQEALEQGLDAIYNPVNHYLAYVGHLKKEK